MGLLGGAYAMFLAICAAIAPLFAGVPEPANAVADAHEEAADAPQSFLSKDKVTRQHMVQQSQQRRQQGLRRCTLSV